MRLGELLRDLMQARGIRRLVPERFVEHAGEGALDKVVHEPGAGMFGSPHGIAVDSQGSFYVADASESYAGLDRGARAVQKFVRV